MYSNKNLERFYFQYQTEAVPHGISLQSFCLTNNICLLYTSLFLSGKPFLQIPLQQLLPVLTLILPVQFIVILLNGCGQNCRPVSYTHLEIMIKEKLKTYIKENPIVNVRMANYKISVMGDCLLYTSDPVDYYT